MYVSGLAAAVFSALALFTSGSGDARNFPSLAAREQLSSDLESYSLDPRHARLVTKAIEEIRPGDVVLAREEPGTKLAPRRVTQVFRRTTDHLRILEIADAAGARQTLKTTDEHPFWVEGRDWLPAGDLEPGAVLTNAAGEPGQLVCPALPKADKRPSKYRHPSFEVSRGGAEQDLSPPRREERDNATVRCFDYPSVCRAPKCTPVAARQGNSTLSAM